MNKFIKLLIAAPLSFASISANADVVTQTFNSSWTVDVWNYYGNVSAMEWQYLPYKPWDSSLGSLTSITVDTLISGMRVNTQDSVHIRESLFTGWNPDTFQYYADFYIPSGSATFSTEQKQTFSQQNGWGNILNYQYFTGIYNQGAGSGGAWYYFESSTLSAAHSISAVTTLLYNYDPLPIPEINTNVMLLMGLGLMGFIARRKNI